MDNSLNLIGGLVLALLGFILPIITVLLSLLPEGVKALTTKYENERKQSDDNILSEIRKKETDTIDIKLIEKNIKILKQNKKDAEIKLDYLKPNNLIIKITIPLLISFLGILIVFQHFSYLISLISLLSIASSLTAAIWVLKLSLEILFEVTNVVSENKHNSTQKIIELLSTLVEKDNTSQSLFIGSKIAIKINRKILSQKELYSFSSNKLHQIHVSISNSADIMAKNVEVGFVFPPEFLIEKTKNVASIFAGDGTQIIRFKEEYIQANTDAHQGDINLTFLKTGIHKVYAFIKGENVKYQKIDFSITVVD